MSVSLHAASGPPPKKAAAPDQIVRRSANYHPCVWGDHFLAYNTPDHSTPDKDTVQKMQLLKEEVKNMLLEAANLPQQQLKLIDDIQRLGVAYHFEVEIDTALKRLNDMYHELCGTKNKDDLGIVSLCFRLLRQHGYNVSSGVFNKYKDESSGTFNECLSKDVEGLLSLYEATYLRVHGEDILDEALAFATSYLKSLKTDPSKSSLAARVLHALELPVWKSLNRIEARHHISVYQDKDSHSTSLLHFAKLDFNVLQKLYQRELGEITSWWKNLNVKEKYPFARDRSVECYFWSLAMSFEPQYQLARRITTKAVCLIIILDDVYDVYGTIEELTLLTDAIQRLEANALDQLPEYMRHIYRALLQFYAELEEELGKAGIPLSRAQYAKDAAEEEEQEARMRMGAAYLHNQRQRANSIPNHGGSTMNHRVIDRNREEGHARLYRDYFSDTPTYTETQFRRRFRMRRSLFMRIEEAVTAHDNYFTQRTDAVGIRGLSSLQKLTAALRMLAYGTAADAVDDYVRIGESTAIESLKRFVKAIVEVFGTEYLRRPNAEDVSRLLAENEQRGFPGMLGSIDCMHWKWKNCPAGWQGMYTGHVHEPTIILEAIASKDLWIWHSFFELPGSLNDINVLDRSHLFDDLAEGRGPEVRYTINGHEYNMGYYLADGIYPSWPTFVKTISKPQGNKKKYFANAQESVRKDVERAFGVLQSRFAMIRGPSRFWDVGTMKYIMTACIILHNMIIEDERELHMEEEHFDTNAEIPTVTQIPRHPSTFREFIQVHQQIRDKQAHVQLQNDLIEHLWQMHGGDIN